jgi:putative endonuclease
MAYYTYIVRCADDTLYTGITTDIERRLDEHNGDADNGARYTRIRRPVQLVYAVEFPDRSSASKEEVRIKRLSRKQKEELIQPK